LIEQSFYREDSPQVHILYRSSLRSMMSLMPYFKMTLRKWKSL